MSAGEDPDRQGRWGNALALAGIGMTNAVSLLGGAALGWLVDSRLGTMPAFLLVGLVSGIVLGTVSTYRTVRRYLND